MQPPTNLKPLTTGVQAGDTLPLRLQIKYPGLVPFPLLSLEDKKVMVNQLEGVNFQKNVIVFHPRDLKNAVFLFGVSRIGEDVPIVCENAYQLVTRDFAGEEERNALPQLDAPILALWLGYSEPPHKRLSPLIEHRMELAAAQGHLQKRDIPGLPRWTGKVVWLYFKGTKQQFSRDYPCLASLATTLPCPIIDLKLGKQDSDALDWDDEI